MNKLPYFRHRSSETVEIDSRILGQTLKTCNYAHCPREIILIEHNSFEKFERHVLRISKESEISFRFLFPCDQRPGASGKTVNAVFGKHRRGAAVARELNLYCINVIAHCTTAIQSATNIVE